MLFPLPVLKRWPTGEALLQYRQLCLLPPVHRSSLHVLRDWQHQPEGGGNSLHGQESSAWEEAYEKDLTSLTSPQNDADPLSRWIGTVLIPWFHEVLGYRCKREVTIHDLETGQQVKTPIHEYSDSHLQSAVHALSTILSSLLPTVPMFALYFISHPLLKIGAIIAFTCVFSAVLILMTKARRIDCFAASAAFAAVQVVFVGYGNGNCTCGV